MLEAAVIAAEFAAAGIYAGLTNQGISMLVPTLLEGREIRRRRASSARIAARRGIAAPQAGQRPRPDLPPGTDLLPQIKHIVVLMMENHSYDNYLGMLAGRGEGFPLGPDGHPEVVQHRTARAAGPARTT